ALALPEPLLLPGPQAEALLRVAQEALTNAARHAGARNVALAISVSAGTLSLSARDDGKGGAGFVPGNGLRGMEERLEALGGTLVVSPEGGPGLCLEARIPLPAEGTA
ncbi:MAG: sensor histidine kinase, partial [Acidobacteria bacterium]|nr:sensor histidine kinase [Acidobacteriota bacterium]